VQLHLHGRSVTMAQRASQVPWCGVPSVMTWAMRAARPGSARQRRTASPPMLCATTSGASPVQAHSRATPASMQAP
jgi:hypothetical protein